MLHTGGSRGDQRLVEEAVDGVGDGAPPGPRPQDRPRIALASSATTAVRKALISPFRLFLARRSRMFPPTYAFDGHHVGYIWDFPAMSAQLATAGFVEITRCGIGESHHTELENLEYRMGPTEAKTCLVVAARKA
jgi:hypothetical protein